MSNTSMVVRVPGSSSTPSTVAIDVFDEVPDPGDDFPVYVQVIDASGNGLPVAGAIVVLVLAGDGASAGTLSESTLTTDANGRATTTLTIDAGATAGSRLYVTVDSVTFP